MKPITHSVLTVALVIAACDVARADADAERETLAMLSHEIALLKARVEQAGKQADTTARVRFRYDYLASDLELVKRGIEDHLDAPRQPRPIPPLKGDFRR